MWLPSRQTYGTTSTKFPLMAGMYASLAHIALHYSVPEGLWASNARETQGFSTI